MRAQNDSSSQDFYSRTLAALEKKQASDQEVAQKLQDIRDAVRAQEPVIPTIPQNPIISNTEDRKPIDGKVLTPTEERNGNNPRTGTEDEDARSIAGRKTMLKGGESKDLHSGKEAPVALQRDKERYPVGKKIEKEEKTESKEDHEVEVELNSILKKGPSTLQSKRCATRERYYVG